ncbi:4021_t:CDS:1, partial [Racocetra fulgida]
EILDNKGIISMLQVEENKELIEQEDENEDEISDLLIAAAKAYDAIQTIIAIKNRKV